VSRNRKASPGAVDENVKDNTMLAELILAFHVLIIAFNLFGLVVVPLGAWRGWNFVHLPAWRLLHIASLGVTALQAALGRACFLTYWQAMASDDSRIPEPIIMKWVNSMIFWPLPTWAFVLIYLFTFAFTVALLWIAPLRWKRR
jgi:hypothetical protein